MFRDFSDEIEIAVMRILSKRFKSKFGRLVMESLSNADVYVNLDIDPNDYEDAHAFSKDYLLYSFLRKWTGWEGSADTKAAAISSWISAERHNLTTNLRFHDDSHNSCALAFISKVKRKIELVLGVAPVMDEIVSLCKWGPGATFDIKNQDGTDAPTKMSGVLSVTSDAVKYFSLIDDEVWSAYRRGSLELVRGNRCVTVPKNAKTDRMIAAEPTVNSFLQQGVGRFIRKRLRAFGVDLSDQTVNQRLAMEALVDDLSTLDLSMASDTLSSSVVSLFLPYEWYVLLDDLRSKYSSLNGRWYKLEKFSSMGNAFTFELETLIFWAISSVICGDSKPVSVYGDDIIVPSVYYKDLVAALAYFGFVVNTEKSYTEGSNFFESCGKHYHSLEDVTPAYQKETVGKNLQSLIRMHNRLYRWGRRNGLHLVKDALLLITSFAKHHHPRLKALPSTPPIEADIGFISDVSLFRRDRNGDFRCLVLYEVPSTFHYTDLSYVGCAYAWKLRRPTTLNSSPDGDCCRIVGARSLLRKKRIWASSLI